MENIVYNFAKITFTPHPSSSCTNFDWSISKPIAMSDTEEEAGCSRPPPPRPAAATTALLATAHTPHSIDEDSISSQDSCSDYNDNEENTDADVSDAHSSCSYAATTSSSTIPGSRGGVSRRRMPARIAKDNFNRISSAIMKPLKKKQRRELSTNVQTIKSIEKIYMNSQHMKKFRPSNLETIFEEPSDENAADAEDDSEEQGSASISEQVRIVKFGSRKLRRAISFNDGLNKNKNLVKKRRLKVKKTFGKRLALKKISMTEFHDRLNKSLDSAMVDEEDEDEQEGQLLANVNIKSTMDDMQLPAISLPASSSNTF
ncbi:protein tantalus [Drosophila tropicalis]|uniref:protein tantalus n=1 Tax=Drosophila tropicalis TaxID=46794 RepID=UPI0035AB89CA